MRTAPWTSLITGCAWADRQPRSARSLERRRPSGPAAPGPRGDAGAATTVRWDPRPARSTRARSRASTRSSTSPGPGSATRSGRRSASSTSSQSRTQGTEPARAHAGRTRPQAPCARLRRRRSGYYGDRGDEPLTEDAPPGDDFLAGVCVQWEDAATPAAEAGIRVVRIRTGIVLGAARRRARTGCSCRSARPRRPDRVGPPVHELDRARRRSRRDPARAHRRHALGGPVNVTAPNPVTNAEFTETLGTVLHRPTVLPDAAAALEGRLRRRARAAPAGRGPTCASREAARRRVHVRTSGSRDGVARRPRQDGLKVLAMQAGLDHSIPSAC